MTLNSAVLKWIEESGFPLEMEVAKEFRRAGFEVLQSSIVLDGQEGKSREVDVLARDPDLIGYVDINCVIECKVSKAHPWVVFVADDVLENYNRLHSFCVSSPDAKEAMWEEFRRGTVIRGLLPETNRCGYAVKQALGGTDHSYGAAISVLKACVKVVSELPGVKSFPQIKFAFPLIVIDAPLFECSLNDHGELVLEEVSESRFLYAAYVPEYAGCCITIVTKRNLPAAALRYRAVANALRETFA
ncbi:hypothetical protein HH213_18055 [Duganella dendranthematis]|uniref:Restriction endonuclease type IV Mrr domain-containing protein n=1 Tax=Duganella dendranthematis TaxID=2728021 RepID=A0ABX6MD92_9BURK|nr:hypothetical protein [Duganella dendranthematis]QJD91827.1 hypothetical protein HH213_18055 [Duganella dendranthematis]